MVRCMEKRSMFPGVAAMKHTDILLMLMELLPLLWILNH